MPSNLRSVTVRLQHPNYVAGVMNRDRKQPSLARLRDGTSVIEMEPGLALSGTVVDPEGKPVSDALILTHTMYSRTPGGPEATSNAPIEDMTSVRTAADGTFSIACLPAGERTFQVLKDGYAPKAETIDVTPDIGPQEIGLDHGGTIRGRLVDSENNPLPRAYVYGSDWVLNQRMRLNARASADENGEFTIENVPTEGELRFSFGVMGKEDRRDRSFLGMSTEVMVPREEPYEITMYRALQFTGNVVDDVTGEAVAKFEVRNGWQLERMDRIDWIRYSSPTKVDSADGEFSKKLDGVSVSYPSTTKFAVGIFAEGYLPATSPLVELGDKGGPFEIRLRKGEPWTGRVVAADGRPLEKAQVAWIEPGRMAFVHNGQLDGRFVSSPEHLDKTNAEGRFKFPASEEPGAVFVVHKEGYAYRQPGQHVRDAEIRLTPWARVEGRILSGEDAQKDVAIVMQPVDEGSEEDPLLVRWTFYDTSHVDGRFEFDFVPSIPFKVGRIVVAARQADLSHSVYLMPKPGRTHVVQVGGEGRTVSGRIDFASSEHLKEAFDIKNVHGVATLLNAQGTIDVSSPSFVPAFAEDGSFSIEDLQPGKYELEIEQYAPPMPNVCGPGLKLAAGSFSFTVSDDEDAQSVSLAPVQLEALTHLEAGQPSPALLGWTFDEQEFSLEKLSGKYVVLDFWATWCAPCRKDTIGLKPLWEKFGRPGKVEFVGINLDYSKGPAETFVAEKGIPWTQLDAGPWGPESPVQVDFAVSAIPSLWVISPEGTVIARDLTLEKLKEILNKLP